MLALASVVVLASVVLASAARDGAFWLPSPPIDGPSAVGEEGCRAERMTVVPWWGAKSLLVSSAP